MPLPASGIIWLSQIRDEFRPGQGAVDLNSYYRNTGVITGNPENNAIPSIGAAIHMSQFYGAVRAFAGSWDQSQPGDYSITVPTHAWLRMRVWGAGAGGSSPYTNGGNGDQSYVSGHLAGGGGVARWDAPGTPGGANGGNQENIQGGAPDGYVGGGSPYGSGGGGLGANGPWPGGGGGGGGGYGGPGGGFAHSYYGQDGAVTLNIHVGAGGAPGNYPGYSVGWGGNGRVLIEWGV